MELSGIVMAFVEITPPARESSLGAPAFEAHVAAKDTLHENIVIVLIYLALSTAVLSAMARFGPVYLVMGLLVCLNLLLLIAACMFFDAAGRTGERIVVRDGAVEITRLRRKRQFWRRELKLFGLTMIRNDAPGLGCLGLWLVLRGERVEVGRPLSPRERETFGDWLEASLHRASGAPPRVNRRACIRVGGPVEA